MNSLQLTGLSETHLTHTLIGQKQFLVNSDVVTDLLALKTAANNAGFNFNIASGFRGYQRQATIWNNKMSGITPILDSKNQPLVRQNLSDSEAMFAILRWSALPGGSRHHWGTEFDVFDRNSLGEEHLKLEPWEYETGHQHRFSRWLTANAKNYGFYFPYANDNGGVAVEPWHISHVKTAMLCQQAMSVEILAKQLTKHPVMATEIILCHLETIYNQFIINVDAEK